MTIVVALLLGALTWSFLEYVIHRWLGHKRRFRANLFAVEHLLHHVEGNYFAPSWKKAVVAFVTLSALTPPAVYVAGMRSGIAYVVGFVGFYGYYEWQHRRNHTHAPRNFYGRALRLHHFTHHFGDARFNHGVTSPLWDWAFNTYRRPTLIRVPERLAMPWLIDQSTARIRNEFGDCYALLTTTARPSAAETVVANPSHV